MGLMKLMYNIPDQTRHCPGFFMRKNSRSGNRFVGLRVGYCLNGNSYELFFSAEGKCLNGLDHP